MAENDQDSGEKEFEASEEKRRQARSEGNVPQSREANTFALFMGILIAALVMKSASGTAMFSEFSMLLYHADSFALDTFSGNGDRLRGALARTLVPLLPVFLVLAVFILIALIVQRSIAFSMKKIKPDLKKISPASNFKKKYGPRGLLDFARDTAKLVFAGILAAVFLVQFATDYYASSAMQMSDFAGFTFDQIIRLVMYYAAFQFVLAAIDLPIQQQMYNNQLKMSRQEMRDELKRSEGDPALKQSRRQKAKEISSGQMLKSVPEATVIMVNPEHYAVALKWDPASRRAPVCVAKGVDHLAARIREIAIENNIPIYRDPPTARSLYRLVDIDEEIHQEHFPAVAAAIKYVERVREHMGSEG